MLSIDELEANLRLDHELRGFELKPPGPRSDGYLFAQVTRACLGMGNLRDGGHVVIGIDDTNPASMSPGLTHDDLASWMKYDDVIGGFSAASDPPLHIEIQKAELSNEVRVVVIAVDEFHEVPHICTKDRKKDNQKNQWVLRKGAIYVRSRRKPETSEIANAGEMRDLLDLAKEKALRSYVETAQRAGLELRRSDQIDEPRPSEQYAQQRKDVW